MTNFQRIDNLTEEGWLELRRTVLTASDIGVLLGLNPWKSVREMTEAKENPMFVNNVWVWLGQQLEPIVVESVNKCLGTEFELFENKAFFVNKEVGLGATPDAGDTHILLECKSTKPHNALKWSNMPPLYYITQLYTQMICCDRQEGYLAILSTNLTQHTPEFNLPLSVHKIIRDKRLDDIIFKEIERYWQSRKIDKLYRVDRKQSAVIELIIRCLVKRIY